MAGGRACRLSITGLQYLPEYAEPIVTVQEVRGEYFYRNGSHYLFYEEQPEGCQDVLRTRVKRRDGAVEICRQGSMGSNMVFEAGKRYRTEYPTTFGVLLLDIVTQTVETESPAQTASENGPGDGAAENGSVWPDVKIRYRLENGETVVGEYELSIRTLPDTGENKDK